MICPECGGKGTAIYYRETARDENSVTVGKVEDICHTCNGSGCKPETNADRIRSMSDEELAEFLRWDICAKVRGDNRNCYGECPECIAEWLKQPAEEYISKDIKPEKYISEDIGEEDADGNRTN